MQKANPKSQNNKPKHLYFIKIYIIIQDIFCNDTHLSVCLLNKLASVEMIVLIFPYIEKIRNTPSLLYCTILQYSRLDYNTLYSNIIP